MWELKTKKYELKFKGEEGEGRRESEITVQNTCTMEMSQ
jgi:hypothetical protein